MPRATAAGALVSAEGEALAKDLVRLGIMREWSGDLLTEWAIRCALAGEEELVRVISAEVHRRRPTTGEEPHR